ncbi:MAG: hypothetical protein HN891_04040 [Planctomycetes bacterium]|jgi:hypothetical protein|nr:hypothetical protein [Planctomycetota bacterium]MBT6452335.1 hypothetical protein [Planctomycetota bacterium]MBT6540404.1 hypothetical protein [Planctomycetota bacterium]MBT6785363.1 hypothetical protein [Planctomycetota bacterium]MBT6968530.1 hypothetical protein [Planctomycetota bacterium]
MKHSDRIALSGPDQYRFGPSICSLFLALLISTTGVGQGVVLTLDTPDLVVAPGMQFDVELRIENPQGLQIQGIQQVVAWNSSSLQLLSLTLPDQILDAPPVVALVWNAPPPVGAGGDLGCSQWWDGQGEEAFSLGMVLEGSWTEISTPLAVLHMRVNTFATNGDSQLSAPAPDLSCGWLGPIVTGPTGDIIATTAAPLNLTVSDLQGPTTLQCASAAETVYLTWQEPIAFDLVQIERDGILLAEIAGGAGYFEDPAIPVGSVVNYRVRGFSSSLPSTASACSLTVDGSIASPLGLSCVNSGSGILMSWQNPLPYQSISISRNGAPLTSLPPGSNSFLDDDPDLLGILDYQVVGSIGGESSDASSCQIDIPIPNGQFIRGDCTADGNLNLADPVTALQYLFTGGYLPCASAADHDDDGTLDLSDGISLLSYLFILGGPPAPPFPTVGADPTPDDLGCDVSCTVPACFVELDGDECSTAILVGLGETQFDTSTSTTSIDPYSETGCTDTLLGAMEQDIWFSFLAPADGFATFSLCDPNGFDSDLVVYEGFCSSMVQLGCNGDDNSCLDILRSRLSGIPISQGASYLIRVGGWDNLQFGSGVLSITID